MNIQCANIYMRGMFQCLGGKKVGPTWVQTNPSLVVLNLETETPCNHVQYIKQIRSFD